MLLGHVLSHTPVFGTLAITDTKRRPRVRVSAIRKSIVVTFDLNNNSETKYLIRLPWQLKARIPPPMTDLGLTLKRTHFYLQKRNKLTITEVKKNKANCSFLEKRMVLSVMTRFDKQKAFVINESTY